VLVAGRHYSKQMTGQQMLWLADRFLKAGTEQITKDLQNREEAARQF
tara:strand:- start:259 stop:399 length:141 start_codon:yes stop_codon:yes gene_type:complete